MQQAEAAPGLLAKLGRVLKEKAAGDYDRFFKGTSKTRERLGVRTLRLMIAEKDLNNMLLQLGQ